MLPPEIILAIAKLVLNGKLGLISTELQSRPAKIKELLTLGHLCKRWRDVALSLLYANYAISIGRLELAHLDPEKSFIMLNALTSANSRFVRNLELGVEGIDIVTNKIFHILESSLFSNTCFVSAASVRICVFLSDECFNDSTNKSMDSKAALLRQTIVRLAPNLQSVSFVYYNQSYLKYEHDFRGISTTFVEHLCNHGSVKSVSATIGHMLFVNPPHNAINNITRIMCSWSVDADNTPSFIRLNAPSLQEIAVCGIESNELDGLIKTPSGKSVVYPYVTRLTLWADSTYSQTNSNNMPVFEDAVPFPRLQHLDSDIVYPFGDNVLFRGNSNKLKSLRIDFDKELLNIITQHIQASESAFESLEKITIVTRLNEADGNYDFISQNTKHLMAVRRSVKYIGMFDYELTDHFVLQLSFEKPFLNVRALQLDEYRASLNNIFAILSAMPAVQMISSGIFEMPEIGDAIAGSGWIDMLYNRFGGAFHRNIQYWRLHFETMFVEGSMSIEYVDVDMSVHYSVLYASVLAVLCPNFKGIWVPSDFTDEYAEGIKEQMNELPFSNYYHLVGRLLRTRGSSDASPSKSDL